MKKSKKIIAVLTAIGILGTAGTVFAAEIKTPAEILSSLTGKSVQELYEERAEGKTYGTIAEENGKLDELQKQILEQRKAILDQRVKDGSLTQDQADEIYDRIQTNQADCDGTGNAGIGNHYGAGFGQGQGFGNGIGRGHGGFGCGNCLEN